MVVIIVCEKSLQVLLVSLLENKLNFKSSMTLSIRTSFLVALAVQIKMENSPYK